MASPIRSTPRVFPARSALLLLLLLLALFSVAGKDPTSALARSADPPGAEGAGSPHSTTRVFARSDGRLVKAVAINGPPQPPYGFSPAESPPRLAPGVITLDVPAYKWSFGCAATAGAMIAAYYDRNGYANLYTGPTGGGLMPLESSAWPNWTDGHGDTYAQCPLTASRQGLDGRTTRGSINDYWVSFESTLPDPYISHGWTQHAWGDAIGDYMKTSQSAEGNIDGSTTFYFWLNDPDPLTCAEMAANGYLNDGTYGRKLFYQARGYTVTQCYNQDTDNHGGGFTFAMYQAEIDAGRPVMVNLDGHTVVGIGYDSAAGTLFIHDTWDLATHSFPWGGSYQGRVLQSVSIVNLASIAPPGAFTKSAPVDAASAQPLDLTLAWSASSGASSYEYCYDTTDDDACTVWVSTAASTSTLLSGLAPGTSYYWQVRAVNPNGLTYADSSPASFWSFSTLPSLPAPFGKVAPADGALNQPLNLSLSWEASAGAASYEYCYDTSDDAACSAWASTGANTSVPLAGLAPQTSYFWQVRALNPAGAVYANALPEAWWTFTTGPGTSQLQDPGFEAYTPSPYWTEASNLYGTPICRIADCGNGGGTAGPRSGSAWAWFGGIAAPEVTGSVSQSFIFPQGPLTLQFHLWIGASDPGADAGDSFTVAVDGTPILVIDATQAASYTAYTQVSVDLGLFADGLVHTLSFSSRITDQYVNFNLDDLALVLPPQPVFADVPTAYWASGFIGRLYAAGITSGCATGPLRYCPEDPVTRAQMAVFLERGLNGAAYTPPPAQGTLFTDVTASHWAAAWIEKLYADAITTGCTTSPLAYCPEGSVTRAQMAVFLLRARHGAGYTPPAPAGLFTDVLVSHWAASWIEQLYAEGITTGCSASPLAYCPEGSVTRAQMAVFLVRAFNLP